MAHMRTCRECGRRYDEDVVRGLTSFLNNSSYCSAKCERAAEAARKARSAAKSSSSREMKQWTCLKCGKSLDRRQGLCNDGDKHEWIDTREYLEAVAAKKARQKRMAEDRRQKATAEYQSFLNSAEGKEQIIKIASGYMARRRTASIWSLILGIITILAFPFGCSVVAFFANPILDGFGLTSKFLKEFGQWIPAIAGLLDKSEFLTLVVTATISFSFASWFYGSLKKRAKVIPQVRSQATGRIVPITDAIKFLASRDISRDFAYEDENGYSCVPGTIIPDTSDTEAEWLQKMEHVGKLCRKKKWAEAADEYRKTGNECGVLTISALAWRGAALCYNMLGDKRALACYKNAVRGYKKLANQGDEGAQESLTEAEGALTEFLNRNTQEGNE